MLLSPRAEQIVEKAVRLFYRGATNLATARCDAMLALRALGEKRLLSDEDWLNDIIEINTSLRWLWRQYSEGNHRSILDLWPAQEFLTDSWKSESEQVDWRSRWLTGGGSLFGTRMVALKDDAVWVGLSDFGFPFPPYARRSHTRVRDVIRNEAMSFGLIDRDRQIQIAKIPMPTALILWEPDVELPDQ